MSEERFDVCVVGAGAAGIACAQGLVRQGFAVALLDRLHPMPDCLKAEKIGGEAALALLRLGFQSTIDEVLTPLHNVAVFFGERTLGTLSLDPPEGGMLYHELANSLRQHLDRRVDFRPGVKAAAIEQRPDGIKGVEVVTDGGERIACRLVVVATGDSRHLLEPIGATYEARPPQQVFAVAFTMKGEMRDRRGPVDSLTYHHPIPGTPIAYATFFRLGDEVRANIFCQGQVPDDLQRSLKQEPLAVLARNRLLAEAARSWEITSPVMIRKVQVAGLQPPAVPGVVVLGDAAHTIDPAGGGGLTFSLLEAELLLSVYMPRWLQGDDLSAAAIQSFYADPRRARAVQTFFARGDYIVALNNDTSLMGRLRRMRFGLTYMLASRLEGRSREGTAQTWKLPAPYLYESYGEQSRRKLSLGRDLKRSM